MVGEKTVLAVVTARANSSGLPGKNYRDLNGKPLVIWSLEAAYQSKYVDSIYVSTNCPHVKAHCIAWITSNLSDSKDIDVKIIDRPDELATPTSKNEEALLHAIQYYEENVGKSPDITINLQPTSPIRHKSLINESLEFMIDTGRKSLMTASIHTPLFVRQGENETVWMFDRLNRPMRQDIPNDQMMLHDDGCLYAFEPNILYNEMCRLDENPAIVVNDRWSSMQIDTQEDFEFCEVIMKELQKTGKYI